jgi:hypothetical protein
LQQTVRLRASKFVQYFLKPTLCLICRVPFRNSFEMFTIQSGEMAFCKPDFIMKSNYYFQNAKKGECFLNVFEALMREITLAVNCHFVHIVQHNQAEKIFNL